MSRYLVVGLYLTAFLLTTCSNIKLATIPSPPPTAKLRIYVQTVSTKLSDRGRFPSSSDEFSFHQVRSIEKILRESGVYEVVGEADVKAVLGDQQLTRWHLEHGDWALARRVAGALYADYTLMVERGLGFSPGDSFFEAVLINTATGKRFGVSLQFLNQQRGKRWPRGTSQAAYRELFRDAKADLLETALHKSGLSAPESMGIAAYVPPRDEAENRIPSKQIEEAPEKQSISDRIAAPEPIRAAVASEAVTKGGSRIVDMEKVELEDTPATAGESLVVYDLEAADNLKPTALILSESLREELFKFRRFSLVNRENMLQLMDELKFQQSGFVDEKQAVQLGKGMAASQVVTGRLGSIGGSFILQAKRIDVQSLGTRAVGSLKCKQGEEEQLLDQLPSLAKKLAGAP